MSSVTGPETRSRSLSRPLTRLRVSPCHRVGAEHHALGRPKEHLAANPGAGAVNPLEVHLAEQRTRLPQAGTALDPGRRNDPGLPLLLRQPLAPGLGDGAERPPRPPPRRRAHVRGNDIPAPTQRPASHVEDEVAASATLRDIEYYHIVSALKPGAERLGRLAASGSAASVADWP